MSSEAVHLRSGGRSRIHKYKTSVKKSTQVIDDLVEGGVAIWLLNNYIKKVGEPKENGAKVVLRNAKGVKRKGVYIRAGEAGVFKVERRHREVASKEEERHDGEGVLRADELDETVLAAVEEQAPDVAGAMTLEEPESRAMRGGSAKAKQRSGNDDKALQSASSGSDDGGTSSDESGDSSHDGDPGSDSGDSSQSPKKKKTNSSAPKSDAKSSKYRLTSKTSRGGSSEPNSAVTDVVGPEVKKAEGVIEKRLAELKGGAADELRGRGASRLIKEL